MLLFFSPLEQFSILLPFYENFGFIITNLIVYFILGGLVIFYVFSVSGISFFNSISFFSELLFRFIGNLSKINIKYTEFFVLYFYLFTIILFNNLNGMAPYAFTTTSSAIVTFFLSFGCFIGICIVGFDYLGFDFLKLFLPAGAPIRILKLLIFIETVSYGIRAFSLAIRLFANMVSGHSLLKILSGFAWAIISVKLMLNILFLFAWAIIGFVTVLECLIAFLQAYVFTFLVSIYLNDSLSGH